MRTGVRDEHSLRSYRFEVYLAWEQEKKQVECNPTNKDSIAHGSRAATCLEWMIISRHQRRPKSNKAALSLQRRKLCDFGQIPS